MALPLIAAAVFAAAAPVSPATSSSETSVAAMLARIDTIRALGDAAASSPELTELKAEIAHIARGYRRDLHQRAQAGEAPASCPPPRSGLTSRDLLNALADVPLEDRMAISVRAIYSDMMEKRYPCVP